MVALLDEKKRPLFREGRFFNMKIFQTLNITRDNELLICWN